MAVLEDILSRFPNISRDALIPILQEVQDEYGYLSEESIREISSFLSLPDSKVYGLATFYNQFRFSPPGRFHIQLCHGTACHLEGSVNLLKEIGKLLNIKDGETTRDGLFSLEVLSCIGACGQAPVMCINGRYFNKVDKNKLKDIIKTYQEGNGHTPVYRKGK